jgi:hypothetical protein
LFRNIGRGLSALVRIAARNPLSPAETRLARPKVVTVTVVVVAVVGAAFLGPLVVPSLSGAPRLTAPKGVAHEVVKV